MDAKTPNNTNLKNRLPSRHVTEGPSRAPHRSYLYAMGLTTQQIHQPFVGLDQDRVLAGENKVGRREVFACLAKGVDCRTRLLEVDPRVEELLHDLQLDDVLIRVPALRAASRCIS